MQFWANFGLRLNSNYWQAKKVFWQTIRRLNGKKLMNLDLKTKMVSYSAKRRISLADGGVLQNPFGPSPIQRMDPGGALEGKYHHCS